MPQKKLLMALFFAKNNLRRLHFIKNKQSIPTHTNSLYFIGEQNPYFLFLPAFIQYSFCQLPLQSISFLTTLIIMIQQHQEYYHTRQPSSLLLFYNAIYQGKYCPTRKLLNGNALIYFPQQKRVIVCSCFQDGQINNQALVYHTREKYLYGRWKNNKLDGVALLRIAETVLVAYFSAGKISEQSKALLLLNGYQLGLLLRLKNGEWQTLQRTEIYCKQHILQLLCKCELREQSISLSLISFLNEEIVMTSNRLARLRFINNKYQYGFEGGLHVIFNQSQQLIGVKFSNQIILNNQEQRSEDQDKRFDALVRKSIERQRTAQAGTIYKQKQHNHQYIFNQNFQDPSLEYFTIIQTTFNQPLLKKLRAGLFRPSKSKYIQQFHLQLLPVNTYTNQAVPTTLQESSIEVINQQQDSEEYDWQRSRTGRDGVIEIPSFQMLPKESRLNIIKQQQKEILHSKILRQKHNSQQSQRNRIEENQSFVHREQQYQNKQEFQDKQSQTNLVIVTSPLANKQQSSPATQKRKRAKIFNKQSPLMTPSPNNKTDTKNTYIQSEFKTNRKLQVEINVDAVQLSNSGKKQTILCQQFESRIAEEIQYNSNDAISVNEINCSPKKFKNKQFCLDNIQIVQTPKREKQLNQIAVIHSKQKTQFKEQHASVEPHFIAIPKPQNKSSNNRRYDTEGISDKKLLFDYIMI